MAHRSNKFESRQAGNWMRGLGLCGLVAVVVGLLCVDELSALYPPPAKSKKGSSAGASRAKAKRKGGSANRGGDGGGDGGGGGSAGRRDRKPAVIPDDVPDPAPGVEPTVAQRRKAATARVREGRSAIQNGDFPTAVAKFRQAFETDDHPKLAITLARAFVDWSRADADQGDAAARLAHLKEAKNFFIAAVCADDATAELRQDARDRLRAVKTAIGELEPELADPMAEEARYVIPPLVNAAAAAADDGGYSVPARIPAVVNDGYSVPRRPAGGGGDAAPVLTAAERYVANDATYRNYLTQLRSRLGKADGDSLTPKELHREAMRVFHARPADAVKLLEHALTMDDHPQIQVNLGKALYQANRKTDGWRAFLSALSHPGATDAQMEQAFEFLNIVDSLGYDDLKEQWNQLKFNSKLNAYTKAAAQAAENNDLNGVAKLQMEAYGLDQDPARALLAAQYFAKQGDIERAAKMYRIVLQAPVDDENDPDQPEHDLSRYLRREARQFLANNNLEEIPRYQHMLSVTASYTKTNRPEPFYLEETNPGRNPWDNTIKVWVDSIARSGGSPENFAALQQIVVSQLGARADVENVLAQGFVKQMGQDGGKSMADIQRVLRASGAKRSLLDRLQGDPADFDTGEITKIQQSKVVYLKSSAEREPYRVAAADDGAGNIVLSQDGQVLETSNMSTAFKGRGYGIYVMGPDGQMYVNSHQVSKFHHSSFLAGSEVAGAGEVKIDNGRITEISNKTGHYKAQVINLVQTLQEVRDGMQQDLAGVKVSIFGLAKQADGSVKAVDKTWPFDAQCFLKKYEEQFLNIDLDPTDPYYAEESFESTWRSLGFVIDPKDASFPTAFLNAP